MNNLISAQYQGHLYAVNPKAKGKLYGVECFASVKDIKEELDLVVIVVPAKFSMAAVDDCSQQNKEYLYHYSWIW